MKLKGICLLILCTVFASNTALAKVSGSCADCHTMHNSQDGINDTTIDGSSIAATSRSLTKGDCIGCHTGENSGGNIPYVTDTSLPKYGPDYDGTGALINNDTAGAAGRTLAGGTFYYVATGDDRAGHNVKGLKVGADADGIIGQTPPGWINGWGTSGIGNDWASNQLTCAGTYGCHGDHTEADDFADLRGAHHSDDSTIDGSTTVKSFRFLKGIIGYEDPDWEYSQSNTDHNQYFGAAHTTEVEVNTAQTLGTDAGRGISTFCGTCHGNFHSGSTGDEILYDVNTGADEAIGTAPWLRHPTDYALATAVASGATEYSAYSGTTGVAGEYNVIAPVATSNNTGGEVLATHMVKTNVVDSAATSIVTCLSCHRAHGSPYEDLLRWNYADDIEAGISVPGTPNAWANKGCFVCHTTKD